MNLNQKIDHTWYSTLASTMPRIATLLECSQDNLACLQNLDTSFWSVPTLRDKALVNLGLYEEFPFIQTSGLHKLSCDGEGITVLQTRYDSSLRYVFVRYTKDDAWGSHNEIIVVPKGKVFKLKRHFCRQNAKANRENAPILSPGMLDEILNSSVGFLSKSRLIKKFGVKIKRGILLCGSPGNGKTLICRWLRHVCNENHISHKVVTASAILKAFQDDYLSDLVCDKPVIFFDDIDISFFSRKGESAKLACSLLAAMDGIENSGNVIRIFTTNEKTDDIDDAFLRPGRIDKIFVVDKPSDDMKLELLDRWPKEITACIPPASIVEQTGGFSFAEIEFVRSNLVVNYLNGYDWSLEKAVYDFHQHTQTENIGFSQE